MVSHEIIGGANVVSKATHSSSTVRALTYQGYNNYNYKVFNLVGHFVLAIQGLLGRCTFIMRIMVISAFCSENDQCPTVIYSSDLPHETSQVRFPVKHLLTPPQQTDGPVGKAGLELQTL